MNGQSVSSPAAVLVAKDRAEHTVLGAELIARGIAEAVAARGVARVALSGGSTPSDTYRHLATLGLPWAEVEWYWVDERAGDPEGARSNYAAAARDLDLAGGKHGRAFRMPSEEADLAAAARSYEALLRGKFGVASAVAFDVMTMGIGDDGHTASLFPGLGVVGIDDRLVAAIPEQPDKKLEARLTLTAPVIHEARNVVMIVRGASKKPVVEAARRPGSEEEIPARILQRARGQVTWVLDQDAAG